jgi:hypothetical protein
VVGKPKGDEGASEDNSILEFLIFDELESWRRDFGVEAVFEF